MPVRYETICDKCGMTCDTNPDENPDVFEVRISPANESNYYQWKAFEITLCDFCLLQMKKVIMEWQGSPLDDVDEAKLQQMRRERAEQDIDPRGES